MNITTLPFTYSQVDESDPNFLIFDDVLFNQDFGNIRKGERFSQIQLVDGAIEVWENGQMERLQHFGICPVEIV